MLPAVVFHGVIVASHTSALEGLVSDLKLKILPLKCATQPELSFALALATQLFFLLNARRYKKHIKKLGLVSPAA